MKTKLTRIAVVLAALTIAGLLGSGPALADSARTAGVVNINTADAAQLQLLPGIGLSKARAILEHRAQQKFKAPEDLIKVKGIGPGLFQKVRKQVVVKGTTTAKPAPARKRTRRKK